MLRISALNDSLSSQDSQASQFVKEVTKEAKEAETYSLYNKALGLLRNGDSGKAETVFRDLIDHDFLQEATDLLEEKGKDAIHPGLQLLYSIYKNLAAMATKKKDYISAMESYLEAVKIDNSEVTVWYKIGMTALKIEDFQLAKGAFEEGLECNPKHWPCLDNIITVMYALNNYSECLYFISKAFEMEIYYDKGHAIRNRIYQDQPCLKSDTEEFYQYCDKELSSVTIDPSEAKMFVEEALHMRRRRQELSKPPEPVQLKFPEKLKDYSWQCVGETLIGLYDKAVNSDPIISLGLRIHVPDYDGVASEKESIEAKKPQDDVIEMDVTDKPIISAGQSGAEEDIVAMETDEKEELPTVMDVDNAEKVVNKVEEKEENNDKSEKKLVTETEKDIIDHSEEGKKKDDTDANTKKYNSDEDAKKDNTDVATDKDKADGITNETGAEIIKDDTNVDTKKDNTNVETKKDNTNVDEKKDDTKNDNADVDTKKVEEDESTKKDDPAKVQSLEPVHEKMDVSDENPENQGKTVTTSEEADTANNDVSLEDSNSLLEAVSIAHSLLESLSPVKSTTSHDKGMTRNPSNLTKKSENVIDSDKTTVKEIPQTHENDAKAPLIDLTNDEKPTILTKASSLGFIVTENLDESTDCVSKILDMDMENLLSPSKVNSTVEKSGVTEQQMDPRTQKKDENVTFRIKNKPTSGPVTSVNSGQSKPDVLTSYTVIDLTESTSDSESQSEMPVPTSSSPMVGPKPISRAADLLSPIPSTKQTNTSSTPNTAVTISTEGRSQQGPGIVVRDFLKKDHAYSKADSRFGTAIPMTSSPQGQGQMLLAGKIPVTQPLQKSVDSNMSDNSVGLDLDDRSPGGRKAQKKRKISLATEEIMMYGKRRSARVRNTGKKKEEEPVNFKNLLKAFLPSSLKKVQEEDNSMMESSKEESDLAEKSNSGDTSAGKAPVVLSFTVWEETSDVKSFLKDLHVKNSGLVDVMNKFLHVTARNWNLKWSVTLCPVFIGVFQRVRKHVYMPNVLDTYDAPDIFQEMALICLALAELKLDYWLSERSKVTGSPSLSPIGKSAHTLLEENIPAHFEDDLMFLTILCGQSDRLGDHWIDHCCRVYWMKSKYAILLGKIEEAIFCYERLKEYLEYMKEEFEKDQVVIPNCKTENVITLDLVTSQQDMLQKSHCVEETQRLYEMAEYERVVEILLQTFSEPQQKAKVMKVEAKERQSQLSLFQDAMFKTGNNGRSVLWGEESLNEAFLEYKAAASPENKSDWLKTMIEILSCLQRVLCREITAIGSLPSIKLVRLSQNLIRMIDKNMSLPESSTEMEIDTVIPWALLFQLIKHEEDKIESLRLKDSNNSDDLDDAISSSQMLLNIAHDYLGGRSWCTKSDGSLLLFFMDVLKKQMERESDNEEDYQQAFEQCVYCLFGHPNKKAKAKHLQDHNSTGITLQWEHATKVFEFFKPKTLPEFDGYKSETISTELEVLFKRIIPLVPVYYKAKLLSHEEVQSYVEGSRDIPPSLKGATTIDNQVLEDIYYLLGDYYLKNKETMKAIKFYMHDLCVNPDRLDAWAGMALARMSQLDSKLTSAEIKMDAPIYKKSIAALRCFKRATEIEDSNAKLWIEYGTLAYQLHTHASKQIRWKKWFAMEQEVVEIAVESKREMLQTAFNCFKQASDWNEEEWLHNYMLGKCVEKMRKPLKDVLQYYFQALVNVHEESAKYPKKIIYAYTTPHLSVEALEMYYRIHTVILKYLMKYPPDSEEIDYKLFVTSIVEAAFVPFVLRIEKGQETKLDGESASSADESSCPEINTPTHKSGQGTADHTYFRQKSNQDTNSGLPASKASELGENDDKVESNKKSPSVVTTMELHAEHSCGEGVSLTTTEVSATLDGNNVMNEDLLKQTSSEGLKKLDDSSQEGKTKEMSNNSEKDKDSVEETVKSVMQHIEDIVVEKVDGSASSNQTSASSALDEVKQDKMEVDEDSVKIGAEGRSVSDDWKDASMDEDIFIGISKGPMSANLSTKKEEMFESLLKLSKEDLHKELTDRCRKAFELCLSRFPTYYKAHYRLAYIYYKSPYFKDLQKAHNILLTGSVKWQQLPYMPCQAMFGERKVTKFFQGIWKIPIDEIDRAGSFPSHLNRCIELTLNILKDQGDCQALHQIHLQLNRQPEPGKKYLRDAEKKFYALTSHRYSLDAAEAKINDMKSITDTEQRHKFLLLFYKIWEHGVHKLNKHAERTNKLLAEAYRVVVRKLETLPHKMLLDQAIRYCKHLLSQKTKSDKDTRSQGGESSSDGKPKSGMRLSSAAETVGAIQKISLETIMKTSTDFGLLKQAKARKREQNGKNKLAKNVADKSDKTCEPIVIDATDDAEMITKTPEVKSNTVISTTPSAPGTPSSSSTTPTVKIKMGLLQAVKRLKPNAPEDKVGTVGDENSTGIDANEDSVPPDIDQYVEDDSSSSSSSSSSSDDGSSDSSNDSSSDADEDDGDDENDEKNDGDDSADADESGDSSSESDDVDNEKEASVKADRKIEQQQPNTNEFDTPDIQVVISSSEEESESSDNSNEVDLVSSENEANQNEKDTDYKASADEEEDDDVIMISDDEFKSKGRAVIPTPPHTEKPKQEEMEVLVEKVPDFDILSLNDT